MASEKQPLSRRALLKSVGIAPLVVLGNKVMAGETTVEDAVDCVKQDSRIPHTKLEKILDKAEKHHEKVGTGSFDRAKYTLVALSLWKYFEIGADEARNDDDVWEHGYDFGRTGETIVENLDAFGPCGNHGTTNICAYLCGFYAGGEASKKPGKKLDKKMYEDAWKQVEKDMKAKKANVEARRGRTLNHAERIGTLGAGC